MNPLVSNKTILIGSDDWSRLGQIMGGLNDPLLRNYALVTVSRPEDLIRPLSEMDPILVILSFSVNQPIIDAYLADSEHTTRPIFCLTLDAEPVLWKSGIHIFTYSFKQALAENSISRRIASVLSLLEGRAQAKRQSFVPEPQQNYWVQDLSRYTLELDQKNTILDRIKAEVELISDGVSEQTRLKLHSLLNLIKQTKADQRYWNEFKQYFNEMNPDFLRILAQKHPSLTSKDLK